MCIRDRTIVGVIAAIVYPMDDITDFLYLIGSVFAPMIAIQDVYKRQEYS